MYASLEDEDKNTKKIENQITENERVLLITGALNSNTGLFVSTSTTEEYFK